MSKPFFFSEKKIKRQEQAQFLLSLYILLSMFRGKPMSQACVVLMVATVCFTHTQFFVILFLIHDNLTMKRKKKKHFLITIMWGEN